MEDKDKSTTEKGDSSRLGVSQEFERAKYDNPYRRNDSKNSFKNREFDGKQTKVDPYTGQKLHYSSEASKNIYGQAKAPDHTSNTDHVVPLNHLHDRYKDNPLLSDNDLKDIANNDYNLKSISERTNKIKQDKTNIEVAFDKNIDIDASGRIKMVGHHVKAQTNVTIDIGKTTIKNGANLITSDEYSALEKIDIAQKVIMTDEAMATGRNTLELIKGNKKLDEAAIDTIVDIAKAKSSKYIKEKGVQFVAQAGEKLTSKAIGEGAKQVGKFVSAQAGFIVTGVYEVSKSLYSYICGEIDGDRFVYEIGEKFCGLAAQQICGEIFSKFGAAAGSAFGPLGSFAGYAVGYVVGTVIYGAVVNLISKPFIKQQQYKQLEEMCVYACNMIKRERLELEGQMKQHFEYRKEVFSGIFTNLDNCILENNIEGISNNLSNLLGMFGKELSFNTAEEFDEFMLDDDSVFVL